MSAQFDDEMKELLESFFIETQEILDSLDQDLMTLESSPEDFDLLNSIFRSFHTIKGTSSFMGFDQITTITHHAEDILNKLRRSELVVSTIIVDALLEVYDWLKVLLKKAEAGDTEPSDYSSTMEKLHAVAVGKASTESVEIASNSLSSGGSDKTALPDNTDVMSQIVSDPNFGKSDDYFSDNELDLIQQAFAQINQQFQKVSSGGDTPSALTMAPPANNPISDPDKPTNEKSEPKPSQQPSRIASELSASEKTSVKAPAKPAPKGVEDDGKDKKTAASESTIRVDVSRLETLMDLSGELVLGRNRLAQVTQELSSQYESHDFIRELQETASAIDFITTEIQSAIMKTRMVPIAKIFQKSPRIVRDLCKEFGKEIELILKGEETELDRGIIEELNDPLVHMIRNSCDHGVEKPKDREASGKSAKGTLILEAMHEGNHILIKIIDDGKGMDPDFLKRKAIEKGVITTDQAETMTDREAFNIIFMPGFSTAEKVTSVSGRGVGMDVVRTNIQKLKGIIEIDSRKGSGTVFTIKLPLTLAIIQGLLVRVQSEIYALPLGSVIEVVNTDPGQIYDVNQNEVIRIRNQVFPLIRMDRALGAHAYEESLDNRYVVVVGLADKRLGLVVDELLGQKEIVIKTLGEYLGHVNGISGSTILGDGRVIMIIDIEELISSAHKSAPRSLQAST